LSLKDGPVWPRTTVVVKSVGMVAVGILFGSIYPD